MWWFTADLHIDHPWIAGHRGFSCCHEHDKAMVRGWNSVVAGGDVVVVLGDMFWSNSRIVGATWGKLKGNKILVKGNHDRWLKKFKVPFKRIYSKTIDKQHIVCCHYPILSWNRKRYGALMLHGHSHGDIPPRENTMDVGVDVAKVMFNEWRPFSFDEVKYLLKGE